MPLLQKHTLALEAVERCITLFMALGNLHWFTAATCPPDLQVSLLQQNRFVSQHISRHAAVCGSAGQVMHFLVEDVLWYCWQLILSLASSNMWMHCSRQLLVYNTCLNSSHQFCSKDG